MMHVDGTVLFYMQYLLASTVNDFSVVCFLSWTSVWKEGYILTYTLGCIAWGSEEKGKCTSTHCSTEIILM